MSEVGRVLPCSAIHFRFVVTLRSSESPRVSLQWVCTCGAHLPSVGSRRPRFPAVISTMRALRPPDLRPFGLFVRQPVPWRPAGGLCIRSRAPAIRQEHSKVLILSDCGGIGQSTSASAGCWRIVICRCGCWSCVNRSSLRDGSALIQSVLVGCGRTWCVARCLAHGVLPAVWRDQRIGLVMLSRAS